MKKKMEKSTTPGIPKRSPILVLTGPDVALLQGSDENWCIQRGMVVDIGMSKSYIVIPQPSYDRPCTLDKKKKKKKKKENHFDSVLCH